MRQAAILFWLLVSIFILPLAAQSNNEDCLLCHGDPGSKTPERPGLYVVQQVFDDSVHGRAGMACVDCHKDLAKVVDFPHQEKLQPVHCAECHENAAKDLGNSIHSKNKCSSCHGTHQIMERSNTASLVYPRNLSKTCEACHLQKMPGSRGSAFIRAYDDSVHARALRKGLTIAASCTSCHGSHDILPKSNPASHVARANAPITCGKCHDGTLNDFLQGVHGKDFIKGITDIPVCNDCHGVHDIHEQADPNSRTNPAHIAELCSRCHASQILARKYKFSINRVFTYAKSYHGIATQYGNLRTANCASCHENHNIRRANDPQSSIFPANLYKTCGRCHKGASLSFARGKIHVWEEKKDNVWAYIIRKFYTIVTILVIGGCLLFIGVEVLARIRRRRGKS
jgi:hypothetical protein